MKLCLFMWYDSHCKDYGDISYMINKMYCDKYNIDLIKCDKKRHNRHAMWERIYIILEHIHKYDYVMWIDADAFFLYETCGDIRDLIEYNNNKNILFSRDIGNIDINSGVFIMKNNLYCIDFLKKWGYDDTLFIGKHNDDLNDQAILRYLYKLNVLDIQNNSSIIDYGILQSFTYNKNSYIQHLAGSFGKNRHKDIHSYFKNIIIKKINNIIDLL
jgi:hypothetical protein